MALGEENHFWRGRPTLIPIEVTDKTTTAPFAVTFAGSNPVRYHGRARVKHRWCRG